MTKDQFNKRFVKGYYVRRDSDVMKRDALDAAGLLGHPHKDAIYDCACNITQIGGDNAAWGDKEDGDSSVVLEALFMLKDLAAQLSVAKPDSRFMARKKDGASATCPADARTLKKLRSLDKEDERKRAAARAWTDDGAFVCEFDAALWLAQAQEKDIEDLAECGWRGDYPADEVARFMSDHDDGLHAMFEHIGLLAGTLSETGFECSVDSEAALRWLKWRRPDVYLKLKPTDKKA